MAPNTTHGEIRLRRLVVRSVLALALAPVACAPATRPSAGPSPAPGDSVERPAPRAIPVPQSFRDAVQRGTRTATGQPGPRYWQQRVRYEIRAELEPHTAALRGHERIVYVNHAPGPLPAVLFNLYQNLFSSHYLTAQNPLNTGGLALERVAVGGRALSAIPQAAMEAAKSGTPLPTGYGVDGTMGVVVLPQPVASGDSVTFEIDWHFKVPPAGAPRTGWEDALGGRVFQVAQWYPQVATYDDVAGPDVTPYTGNSEFYLEYGDFDVDLTLPAGWIVGATGTLRNADEVLPPETRRRLDLALSGDTVVHVLTSADLGSRATLRGADGRTTWRFSARDVRDFAFATSDRYLWDATRATIPQDGGTSRTVAVHSLYRRGAPGWGLSARYGQHAVGFLSRLLIPYIYPQVTVSEGPEYGMEYPQLVFIGRPSSSRELEAVIAHEVGHEWFPMMVGPDESAFAWMDEGINTYDEARATADYFPGSDPWEEPRAAYLGIARSKAEVPMMHPIDDVKEPASGIAAYFKPGTVLRSLNAVVGDSVYRLAMRTYSRDWLLKHPYPWDFFDTFERVSGRDLDWFIEPWWFRTATLDQAVGAVTQAPGGVTVTVRDLGDAPAPAIVVATLADGTTARATIPGERFAVDRRRTVSVTIPATARAVRVEIDPEQLFPDTNRRNNVWTAPNP
jgi:hypothetical protein